MLEYINLQGICVRTNFIHWETFVVVFMSCHPYEQGTIFFVLYFKKHIFIIFIN